MLVFISAWNCSELCSRYIFGVLQQDPWGQTITVWVSIWWICCGKEIKFDLCGAIGPLSFGYVTCSPQSPLVQAKEKTINIRCSSSWAASRVVLSRPSWSDSVTDERLKKKVIKTTESEVTISLTHHKTISKPFN